MKLILKFFVLAVVCLFILQTVCPPCRALAEKRIICSACGKKISEKYIVVGSYTYHPGCLICSKCGKLIKKNITGNGPGFYHQECYKRSLGMTCSYCKGILGDQWTESGGKKYHPACYKKNVQLICAICGKSIEGKYTKNEEGAFHESCYRETKLERCTVCGLPIEGRYLKDDWGNLAHETHEGQGTSFCDSCNRIISAKTSGGGLRYDDGRMICGICITSAVNEPAQIKASQKKVLTMLSGVGLKNISSKVPIYLVDKHTLLKKSRKQHSENTKGFTYTQIKKIGGLLTLMDHSIYILNGLPLLEFEGVLAHEFIHVWLTENHINMSESDTEGFCNLGVMLVNMSEDSSFARVLQDQIAHNPDPVYGNGYRNMKKQLDKNGWKALIQIIKEVKPDEPS